MPLSPDLPVKVSLVNKFYDRFESMLTLASERLPKDLTATLLFFMFTVDLALAFLLKFRPLRAAEPKTPSAKS